MKKKSILGSILLFIVAIAIFIFMIRFRSCAREAIQNSPYSPNYQEKKRLEEIQKKQEFWKSIEERKDVEHDSVWRDSVMRKLEKLLEKN